MCVCVCVKELIWERECVCVRNRADLGEHGKGTPLIPLYVQSKHGRDQIHNRSIL